MDRVEEGTTAAATRARLKAAILSGGLVAGALDISDALIFHGARGVAPWRILQAIASGLLDPQAFPVAWQRVGVPGANFRYDE